MANTQVQSVQAITLLHITRIRDSHRLVVESAEFLLVQSGTMSGDGAARVRLGEMVGHVRICTRDVHTYTAHRALGRLQHGAHLHCKDVA